MQFFANNTNNGQHHLPHQSMLPLPTTTLSRVGSGAVSPNSISTGSPSSAFKAVSPTVSPTNVPMKRTYNSTTMMHSPPIITPTAMNKRQKLEMASSTGASPFLMRQVEESMRRRRAIDILLLGNNKPSAASALFAPGPSPTSAPTSSSSSMSATADAILTAHSLMMERQRVLSTILMARNNAGGAGGINNKSLTPSAMNLWNGFGMMGNVVPNYWSKSIKETEGSRASNENSGIIIDTTTNPSSAVAAVAESIPEEQLSPNVLYNIGDERCLSQFQCLARKQIELFEATQDDVDVGARGRNIPIKLGQVGIRCKHCTNHVTPMSRKRAAVYFPTKLDRVYQTAINMATLHLCQSCDHVPLSIRNELLRLKDQKSTSGGGKRFVAIGIKKQNVIEVDGGLRFASSSPSSSTSTSTTAPSSGSDKQ